MNALQTPGKPSPIGLFLGDHVVGFCQTHEHHGQTVGTKHSMLWRTDAPGKALGPVDAKRIADHLLIKGYEGKTMALCPSLGQVVCGLVDLSGNKHPGTLAQYVQDEFVRVHGLENRGFEMVCWPTDQKAKQPPRELFAVGCEHRAVMPALEQLDAVGLACQLIGSHPTALSRACTHAITKPGPQVVIGLELEKTTLTLAEDRTVFYHSDLPCGGLLDLIRAELGKNSPKPPTDEQCLCLAKWLIQPKSIPAHGTTNQQVQAMASTVGKRLCQAIVEDLQRASAFVSQRTHGKPIKQGHLAGIVAHPDTPLMSVMQVGLDDLCPANLRWDTPCQHAAALGVAQAALEALHGKAAA